MRVSTEIGQRSSLHASGAGKAILAILEDAGNLAILSRTGLPARTPRTLRTISELLADVDHIRSRGYSIDDEAEELSARSHAVTVPRAASPMALSLSGPVDRISGGFATLAEPALHLRCRSAQLQPIHILSPGFVYNIGAHMYR